MRRVAGAKDFVSAHQSVLQENTAPAYRGQWRKLFDNEADIHLEIGMGRGRFIVSSAAAHPDVNYLGLELREEMVMDAISRIKQPLPNLRFLQLNADLLPELFSAGEVNRIYINFPDPWPKSRHDKRRLTAPRYLNIYQQILADDGELYFKTDNQELFEWSLANFADSGLDIVELNYNLPEALSGIMTEYERRFRASGQPIFFVRLLNNHRD